MAGGIEAIAASISADLVLRLPRQNKKQREGLGMLVATMLQVRSANLMDLSASLPREAERIDMRYQCISRLLGNERIDTDWVMAPFAARSARACFAPDGQRSIFIIDQTQGQRDATGRRRRLACRRPLASDRVAGQGDRRLHRLSRAESRPRRSAGAAARWLPRSC